MEPCRRRAIWAEQASKKAVLVEAIQEKEPPKVVEPYMCPKCNREYRRGMYFHQKYCRGL